ncbi:MAG: ATP-binding protein [Ignavibacteriales bacterium]|nr:ATP-binding protein [Ignavibacteriales bacterium]
MKTKPSDKSMKFRGLTKKTKRLLSGDENYEVDFKLKSTQIDPEDFVSFANSKNGGTILFGVKEVNVKGLQKGEIVGCEIGDKQKQIILDKALSCSPSIDILILVENLKSKPIFRVEINSGEKKPYSTNSGKYLIRENGRNRALHPVDLLKIFIENETGEFVKRFNTVTQDINTKLQILNKTFLEHLIQTTEKIIKQSEEKLEEVIEKLSGVNSDIDYLSDDINQSLKEIYDSANNAESLSDDAMLLSDENNYLIKDIFSKVQYLENDLMNLDSRMKLLLNHFNIEDPIITKQKLFLKDMFKIDMMQIPNNRYSSIVKKIKKRKYFVDDQIVDKFGKECYNRALKELNEENS